ncbi:MAG: PDZ domain-containing protein [Alphaproteobacteria bacterium]|nr:PDZ domain-containing protein [Alphaproteobacteria bacterium]
MPDLAKHLAILGLAVPVGLGGYHLVARAVGGDDPSVQGERFAQASVVPGEHRLARLAVLERDLTWLEGRYVQKERLDPDAMFQGALDRVERTVPEVMFQREPKGRRLHVSVGDHSTVLLVETLDDLGDMQAALRQVAEVLDSHLSEEVDRQQLEYDLVNGALSALDPHTILMPPKAADEMDVDNKGEFGGLGIEITIKEGRLTIKAPIDDTPADKAGLKADDQIVRIEDESTINMDLNDAVSKLRGKPGDPVTIHVARKGWDTPHRYEIKRAIIKVNPVESELLEGDVGYVRIKAFNAQASADLGAALKRFERESDGGLNGVVLDLRDNPGGYLTEAIAVSDFFLNEGVIVSTVDGGSGRREENRATRKDTVADFPVVVLVNGSSASASEIVAGALRNHDRAVIVGERTFGKGSVQNLYDHSDGSRLKMTVARYLTPGDQSIQGLGIAPDIELRPVLAEPPEADSDDLPLISMYWRDWLDREADYDHSLVAEPDRERGPTWSVRYLRDADADPDDPNADWEVGLAREVVLAAGDAWRRPDVLVGADRVVRRHQEQEDARIAQAFSAFGIDWSAGDEPAAPALHASLDLGDDGKLVAGQQERIHLVVENRGATPAHRLSVWTESDNPFLDHREFYVGEVEPGASVRVPTDVTLAEGYPSGSGKVTLHLRTPDDADLAQEHVVVQTEGRGLPRFHYALRLVDDGTGDSRGDGDGIPEVGELVELEVSVTNAGDGPTSEAFVRLRNRSGRVLDLRSGSIEVGQPRTADGRACANTDVDGCSRVLDAGETMVGRVGFEVRDLPADGAPWKLELTVGDNAAYDFATVQSGGFFSYFQQKESIELTPGQPLDGRLRQPPHIDLTRGADGLASGDTLVVSGLVTDDRGLRDVMVFHGEDKVFYKGGDGTATALPLTVERALEPGENLIVVLARDDQGLTATRAVTAWGGTDERTAAAPTPESDAKVR